MRPLKKYIDQELVKRLKGDDIKAFEELYFRYNAKLKSFSKFYLKDANKSEEAVHEVFIKIWEKRSQMDENQCFKAYLFQIIKNHIFNLFRKKAREVHLEDLPVLDYFTHNITEEEINLRDLTQLTDHLMDDLPLVQRKIFKMSRVEELNNEEISQKLNLSKRTVEHHIYLALKTLKKNYDSFKVKNLY